MNERKLTQPQRNNFESLHPEHLVARIYAGGPSRSALPTEI